MDRLMITFGSYVQSPVQKQQYERWGLFDVGYIIPTVS